MPIYYALAAGKKRRIDTKTHLEDFFLLLFTHKY